MVNGFRLLADSSHVLSKCILIVAIHWNGSAEGVSLLTQILYAMVFVTRYLDLFWDPIGTGYNTGVKAFYIVSSLYIIVLMTVVYSRSKERGRTKRLALSLVVGSMALSLTAIQHFYGLPLGISWFVECCWAFSIILESVAVLPQLLLLRQTNAPTVINSYYLLALGSYRGLYILNWIVRYTTEGYWDPIAQLFGVLQTALYIDFAWVYWTRQRVKLREKGIVDSEDFRRGFLLCSVAVRRDSVDSELEARGDEEKADGESSNAGSWRALGISASADDKPEEPYYSEKAEVAVDEIVSDGAEPVV